MLGSRCSHSCGWTVLTSLALVACGGGSGDDTNIDAAMAHDAAMPPDAVIADARPDAFSADAFELQQGASCDDPIPLTPGSGHAGDTSEMLNILKGSCSPGTATAKETKYLFDMGKTPRDLNVRVAVDETADPPFDAVLHARTNCVDNASEIACADSGYSERVELLGVSGPVYVVVDGTLQHGANMEGSYTLSSSVRDIVAIDGSCDPAGITSRCETDARCVAGTCVADSAALACSEAVDLDISSGSATATATTFAYDPDFYQGSCPFDPTATFGEHIYRIVVTSAGTFDASTDNATTDFDTYLYLRRGTCDGTETACHDDVDIDTNNLRSHITVPNLQPGTWYLFVDGSSASPGTGTYQLDVTLVP